MLRVLKIILRASAKKGEREREKKKGFKFCTFIGRFQGTYGGKGEQGSDELIARSLPRMLTIPFIMH